LLQILRVPEFAGRKPVSPEGTKIELDVTMLSLKKTQRALLSKQLSDAGNLAAASLVFGPFISSRPSYWKAWLTGFVV
jgi:hypothetical protein